MPHGISAIKDHLRCVDNVPLLVSLFTDATPTTVRDMVRIFREHGEVVYVVGGGYRAHNAHIFGAADLATSVAVLPSLRDQLPASEADIVHMFPTHSSRSLCRADILLSFRVIGLGTVNLLQAPYQSQSQSTKSSSNSLRTGDEDGASDPLPYLIDMEPIGGATKQAKLSVLLEELRKGRVLYRNALQALALYCVSTTALMLWPVLAVAIPTSVPPIPPPSLALLFTCLYLPVLLVALLLCGDPEDGVMKNTPRKGTLVCRPGDRSRFWKFLLLRCLSVSVSVFLVGWLAAASAFKRADKSFVGRWAGCFIS